MMMTQTPHIFMSKRSKLNYIHAFFCITVNWVTFFSSSFASIQLSFLLLSCNEVLHRWWSSWSMKDQLCCRQQASYILCPLRERPWRHSVPKRRHTRAHYPDRLRKHLAVLRHKLLTRRNSLVRSSVAIDNRCQRVLTLECVALGHCRDELEGERGN